MNLASQGKFRFPPELIAEPTDTATPNGVLEHWGMFARIDNRLQRSERLVWGLTYPNGDGWVSEPGLAFKVVTRDLAREVLGVTREGSPHFVSFVNAAVPRLDDQPRIPDVFSSVHREQSYVFVRDALYLLNRCPKCRLDISTPIVTGVASHRLRGWLPNTSGHAPPGDRHHRQGRKAAMIWLQSDLRRPRHWQPQNGIRQLRRP